MNDEIYVKQCEGLIWNISYQEEAMPAKFDLFRKKTLTKTEKYLPRLAIASFKYLSLHLPIPARLIIQVVNRAMLNIEKR